MKRRGFIDNFRDLMRGFANGITEFIRSWQEVQEDLDLEPIAEEECRTILRVCASFALLLAYGFGIALLARCLSESPLLFFCSAICSALLTASVLRLMWDNGRGRYLE
jgi:hypothetical protein